MQLVTVWLLTSQDATTTPSTLQAATATTGGDIIQAA